MPAIVYGAHQEPQMLSLEHRQMAKTLRVAITAPHPDDFDAIAVTMRMLHRNGNTIDLAVLTSGMSGVV